MNEREIFTEALDHADAADRARFLDSVCGPNRILRSRVEQLLAMHDRPHSMLDCRPTEILQAIEVTNETTEPTVTAADNTVHSLPPVVAALRAFLAPPSRTGALGRLKHYEIREVLGCGGYGIVLKAWDEKLQRVVAIKVLAPHLALTGPPRQRFLREARAAGQVRHEHVVQVYAVEEDPLPFLAMEFVPGQTLQQKLDATGPLDAGEVVRIGRQIALGLAAAHEQGLVHRDIKPSNIMLESGPEPRVKLTDFGLAQIADETSLTTSGSIAGTPVYMAPEQARGEPVDCRADLFSLGSVLYTMCVGRPPFWAPTTFAVLKRVVEETPPPVRSVLGNAPGGLSAIVEALHRKDPAERFSSANEVAEALGRCLSGSISLPRKRSALLRSPRLRKTTLVAAMALIFLGGGWLARELTGGGAQKQTAGPLKNAEKEEASIVPAAAPEKYEDEPTWEEAVMLLPPGEQAALVVGRLKELNPELDAKKVWHRIVDGVVVSVGVNGCEGLNDLSPLRALPGLTYLGLRGRGAADLGGLKGMKLVTLETNGCPIQDLSPLAGMPLKTLNLWQFQTDDLSPLRGMKLEGANLGGSRVKDISVLKGMPLDMLCLNYSQIEDLSPLQGAPLRVLECCNTRVTSIAPLAESPLERLYLQGSPIADFTPLKSMPLKVISLNQPERHVELLSSIQTLETINSRPAAEVLQQIR